MRKKLLEERKEHLKTLRTLLNGLEDAFRDTSDVVDMFVHMFTKNAKKNINFHEESMSHRVCVMIVIFRGVRMPWCAHGACLAFTIATTICHIGRTLWCSRSTRPLHDLCATSTGTIAPSNCMLTTHASPLFLHDKPMLHVIADPYGG